MIDQKTIQKQKVKIRVFFVFIGLFFLTLFLLSTGVFTGYLDGLYYWFHPEEAIDHSLGGGLCGTALFQKEMRKLSWELIFFILVPAVFFLLSGIVSFFAFRIPKAFRILRTAKLIQKGFMQGDEIPVSQKDFEEYTLRPDSEVRDRRPQNGFTQDFASLFETTARIYDGKETTENIPEEADNTASGSFYILEDLCFLGSEERIV